MAMEDLMESLQSFDMDQLNDFNNVGNWPVAIKIILWVLVFAGVLVLGYFLHVTNLQEELAGVQSKESQLRTSYEEKYAQAAHLDAYRVQQKEMEESFLAILQQLPSDTEIPGLLDDINTVALENGLSIQSIDLQPEVMHEFYIEKPITIIVSGGYHEIGSFVSDVADLSRIVTLHDFTISPLGGTDQGQLLSMAIIAKTYRYNDARG